MTFVRATFLAFAMAMTSFAQDAAMPIAEVNRILTTQSDAAPRNATIRGVVNFSVPSLKICAIQQQDSGLFVRIPESADPPTIGDEIEIVASVMFESTDPDTTINAETLKVVGHPGTWDERKNRETTPGQRFPEAGGRKPDGGFYPRNRSPCRPLAQRGCDAALPPKFSAKNS